jgi:hypothetical protein
LIGCLCYGASGCGSGDVPDLARVSGVVKLGGQPLAGAQVRFQPEQGRPSLGITDASGNYELQYNADNSGALIGKHVVRISTFREEEVDEDGRPIAPEPERVPAEFNVRSTLVKDVQPGSNRFDFDIPAEGEIIQPGDEPPEGNE